MSGHSRWSMIKNHQELSDALGETPGDEIRVKGMIHFCQGYLLALEDLLSDLEDRTGDFFVRELETVETFTRMINATKEQATVTLSQLQKRMPNAE